MQIEVKSIWFEASTSAIYFKRLDDDSYIILCLYVDDMLVFVSNIDHIKGLKE